MEVVHGRCCGLDVHKASITACILIRENGKEDKFEKQFGTFTGELEELAEWLEEHQVSVVAMEATGVYWKPVWNVLEGRFDLLLVNPEQVKGVAGSEVGPPGRGPRDGISAAWAVAGQLYSNRGDPASTRPDP